MRVVQGLEIDRYSWIFSLVSLFSCINVMDVGKPETEMHDSTCPMLPSSSKLSSVEKFLLELERV